MRPICWLLVTLLLPLPALAAPPTWTLQIDPLTTALGFAHVQVEHAPSPQWSVYAGPHLRLFDSPLTGERLQMTGLGVEVGVRRFVTGAAPQGAWLQVRGVAARVASHLPAEAAQFGGYVSALAGCTWIWQDFWVLAGGLGGQYIDYTVAGRGPRGLFPAAHTAVGVAF